MAVCALGNHSGGRRCVRLAESARGGRRLAAGGRAAAPLTFQLILLYYPLPCKLQSGDTDLERFLVYLCIGVKLLILDTLSTYTYEIDLKNLHLNTPFLLVLNNSMRGGVNNFMPFRKQRLSKCCIFGDIFSKYMNLSIFVLRLI